MPVQINLGGLKIATVDKAWVNIGPSVHVVNRAHQHQNMGLGEVIGDGNLVDHQAVLHDQDIIDTTYQKNTVYVPRGPR